MVYSREMLEMNHFKRMLADYEWISAKLEEGCDSSYLAKQMDRIKEYLNSGECSEQCFKIYCDASSTYELEARKLYMDARTLRRRVDKDILAFLKR